jgi:hypothetical protein
VGTISIWLKNNGQKTSRMISCPDDAAHAFKQRNGTPKSEEKNSATILTYIPLKLNIICVVFTMNEVADERVQYYRVACPQT